MRIETKIPDDAYRDLVRMAQRKGLSLASYLRMLVLEDIRCEKWGDSIKRDGRSNDSTTEG
jgi:hypothetical protein